MIRHPQLGSGLAAGLLLAIVVVTPLAFGGVLPRERALGDAAAFLALALAVISLPDPGGLRSVARPVAGLAAVAFLGFAQALPWPAWWVGWLAPKMISIRDMSLASAEAASSWIPLSLAPAVTRQVALHWLAVAAVAAAAAAIGGERRWRRLLSFGLLAAAVFEIVYGADHWFSQSSTIWGYEVAGERRLRGTFVNPDHCATYLIIPLCASFAWVWWSMRRVFRGGSFERRLLHVALPWLTFLLVFVGLTFTGSRMGLVAAVAAILAQALILAFHYRRWQGGLLGAGAVLVGLAGVLYFGLQQGLGRWLDTSAYDIGWNSRVEVYRATLDLWLSFPLTGTGLGTFRQAFPLVQPADLTQTWVHAHSDPLELAVTAGPLALVILGWAAVGLARTLWRVLDRGRRSEDRGVALAACGALVGVAVHVTTDFGTTIPANAFTLAILAGLACAAPTVEKADAGADLQGSRATQASPLRRAG